ncbi:MAG TPA: DUF4434 domain-containing protein [Terracidiphilus sp.]|nr:DUF4434 domain-containing protein [Terracidiphilus sp.]
MHISRWTMRALILAIAIPSALAQPSAVRLELIPPSPITDKIDIDIRGAIENNSSRAQQYAVRVYLDHETEADRISSEQITVPAHASSGVYARRSASGLAGKHHVILVVAGRQGTTRSEQTLEVLPSETPSTRTIDGAWIGLIHWSDEEARYWNADLRKLSEQDWQQQIEGMHSLGMDTVVVQQVFQNQEYYGRNDIAKIGYQGMANYPSQLYPGRSPIASHDALDAILSQADALGMHVFLGVGMYAWFDFSAASLDWHKNVAAELWRRYGHHPSFYGWYVSEEVYGNLIPDQGEQAKVRYRAEIIHFFAEFQAYCRSLAPEKPVMLAPNAHGLLQSQDVWPQVLEHVDILCPFGFARMPEGDLTGEQAAATFKRLCNQTHTHLWMDLEAFTFEGSALIPRPVAGLVQDLQQFPDFEKILCYQYTGIFNVPEARMKPGGARTVVLYEDYLKYLDKIGRKSE